MAARSPAPTSSSRGLRLQGLKGSASYLVSTIKSIDDTDPAKVVVTLTQSNSAFLPQVNASYLGIVEKKLAEAQGATADPTTDKAEPWFLANSAGSGPFRSSRTRRAASCA